MVERTRRRSASSRGASEPAGGGRLNRDYSDEEYREPSEGYQGEQPTKGLYTCELVGVTDHTKKDDDEASSTKWLFRLVEGSENKNGDDVSGWMDSIYTTENTLWREQQMLVALGVIKPKGKVNLTYEGIVKKAKQCTVRVGTERYIPEDGGDPEWRGRMQAFLPLRDSANGPKTGRAKDEEPEEDVFDDEDAEDEDDEEEAPEPARRSTSRSRRKAAEPEPEPEEEDEAEDEADEDEPYDADELAAELEDLSLPALKKRAKDEFGISIKRGMDSEAIIDAIIDTLDEGEEDEEDDEDEPEEEPEPPKRRSSRTSAKTGGSSRAKRGSSQDPPF